jgi:hypothetical protein
MKNRWFNEFLNSLSTQRIEILPEKDIFGRDEWGRTILRHANSTEEEQLFSMQTQLGKNGDTCRQNWKRLLTNNGYANGLNNFHQIKLTW